MSQPFKNKINFNKENCENININFTLNIQKPNHHNTKPILGKKINNSQIKFVDSNIKQCPILIEDNTKIRIPFPKKQNPIKIDTKTAYVQKKNEKLAKAKQEKTEDFNKIIEKIKEINPFLKKIFELKEGETFMKEKSKSLIKKTKKTKNKMRSISQKEILPKSEVITVKEEKIDKINKIDHLIFQNLKKMRKKHMRLEAKENIEKQQKIKKELLLKEQNKIIREINKTRFLNNLTNGNFINNFNYITKPIMSFKKPNIEEKKEISTCRTLHKKRILDEEELITLREFMKKKRQNNFLNFLSMKKEKKIEKKQNLVKLANKITIERKKLLFKKIDLNKVQKTAAIFIQKFWRGYSSRKYFKMYIVKNNDNFSYFNKQQEIEKEETTHHCHIHSEMSSSDIVKYNQNSDFFKTICQEEKKIQNENTNYFKKNRYILSNDKNTNSNENSNNQSPTYNFKTADGFFNKNDNFNIECNRNSTRMKNLEISLDENLKNSKNDLIFQNKLPIGKSHIFNPIIKSKQIKSEVPTNSINKNSSMKNNWENLQPRLFIDPMNLNPINNVLNFKESGLKIRSEPYKFNKKEILEGFRKIAKILHQAKIDNFLLNKLAKKGKKFQLKASLSEGDIIKTSRSMTNEINSISSLKSFEKNEEDLLLSQTINDNENDINNEIEVDFIIEASNSHSFNKEIELKEDKVPIQSFELKYQEQKSSLKNDNSLILNKNIDCFDISYSKSEDLNEKNKDLVEEYKSLDFINIQTQDFLTIKQKNNNDIDFLEEETKNESISELNPFETLEKSKIFIIEKETSNNLQIEEKVKSERKIFISDLIETPKKDIESDSFSKKNSSTHQFSKNTDSPSSQFNKIIESSLKNSSFLEQCIDFPLKESKKEITTKQNDPFEPLQPEQEKEHVFSIIKLNEFIKMPLISSPLAPVISIPLNLKSSLISSPLAIKPTFEISQETNDKITEEIVSLLILEVLDSPLILKAVKNEVTSPSKLNENLLKSPPKEYQTEPPKQPKQKTKEIEIPASSLEKHIFNDLFLEYLIQFKSVILYENPAIKKIIIKNINEPLGLPQMERLRKSRENAKTFSTLISENVILPFIDRKIPIQEIIPSEYFIKINEEIALNYKNFDKNYFRSIFDELNHQLNYYRPFGLKQKPYIWDRTFNRSLKPQKIENDKLDEIIEKCLDKIEDFPSFLCGIFIDKDNFMKKSSLNYENFLAKTREEKMKKMLAKEFAENVEDWLDYADDQLELKLEISNMVFQDLINELAEEIKIHK